MSSEQLDFIGKSLPDTIDFIKTFHPELELVINETNISTHKSWGKVLFLEKRVVRQRLVGCKLELIVCDFHVLP